MDSAFEIWSLLAERWADAAGRAAWQGGIAIVAALALCRLYPALPTTARCWLWRLICLKVLAAFLWTTPVDLPLLSPPAPPENARPAPHPSKPSSHVEAGAPLSVPGNRRGDPRPALPGALLGLWLLGVGWCASRLVREVRDLRRKRRQCRPVQDERWVSDCATVARALRLRRTPALLTTEGSGTPMLVGIPAPAILLPAALLAQAEPTARRLILAHELAHLRRRDLLWNWLPAAVHALFWFHPLVWLVGREWRLAQELACDELALRVTGAPAADYARLLLQVTHQGSPFRPATTVAGLDDSPHALARRLKAMRDFRRLAPWRLAAVAAALGLVAVWAIVPWRLVEARAHPMAGTSALQLATGDVTRVRTELEAAYAVLKQVFTAGDLDRYSDLHLPDFVALLDKGERLDRVGVVDRARQAFADRIGQHAFDVEIESLDVTEEGATTTVLQRFSGTTGAALGRPLRGEGWQRSRDTWRKTPRGWKMHRIEVLEMQAWADGRPLERRDGSPSGVRLQGPARSAGPAAVVGRVRYEDGDPAAGVRVEARPMAGFTGRDPRRPQRQATTDSRGAYRVEGLPAEPFAVAFLSEPNPGWTGGIVHVTPQENDATRAPDLVLVRSVTVRGIVTEARTGQPLPGVMATLSTLDDQDGFGTVDTDANGRFYLQGQPGSLIVRLMGRGPGTRLFETGYDRLIAAGTGETIMVSFAVDWERLDQAPSLLPPPMAASGPGSFSGIGAQLHSQLSPEGWAVVRRLIAQPAAAAAGHQLLQPGDRITHVDGQSMHGRSLDEVVGLLRGRAGSTVRVTVLREGLAEPVVVTVRRRTVQVAPHSETTLFNE
jgi:beta-lactamase regulating signal transducer with metallopeptidase domain/ketosteroid isomerase-like protein